MQKRHDNLLTARLEIIVHAGVAHVLWGELYTWYDVEKIAARTYRDLNQRWEEITEGSEGRLMKIEGSGGIFLTSEKKVQPLFEEKTGLES